MPFVFTALDDNQRQLPFFLATIGHDWRQEPIRRPEGYPWYQWIQCLEGQGVLILNGQRHEIGPGMGFFLLPDEAHEYMSADGKPGSWITDWIGFGGFAVPEMLRQAGLETSGVRLVSNVNRMKTLFREIMVAAQEDSAFSYQETSLLLYEFLLSLRGVLAPRTRNAEPRHARLRPVIQHIRRHYMQDLSIGDLAKVIDVTPQYLCHIFRQSLGMRPFEYLSSYRISRAKELLVSRPELQVAEIARLTGFSDSNYLCRVFKKSEGISPGAFRALHIDIEDDDMKK